MRGEEIAGRAVRGSAFSIASSAVTIVLGLIRSILLARLLVPEDFGVVRLALIFFQIAGQLGGFGLDAALIHRDEDLERAYATHFVLNLALKVLVALACLLTAPLLARLYPEMPALPPVFVTLAWLGLVNAVIRTPEVSLRKELRFGQIAILDVLASLSMTIGAPLLAWLGFGYWALVAERAIGLLVRAAVLWFVLRPWALDLHFDRRLARWYLHFGARVFASTGLTTLLDRFDDFWIGTALGATPLGFYSRAYEFARYPRRVVANPVMSVLFPTFAKVQHDRLRLSQAFFRASSLIVRAGFLFGGAFMLVTPEFIRLFLGEKWLPMALTFQLMLVYTLLDPLSVTASNLTTAVGRPGVKARVRFFQLLLFAPAVILGARWMAIDGVALAADLMMALGVFLLFRQARRHVDLSLRTLLFWPTVGLAAGLTIVLALMPIWTTWPDWATFAGKAGLLTVIYGTVLLLFEHRPLLAAARQVWRLIGLDWPAARLTDMK